MELWQGLQFKIIALGLCSVKKRNKNQKGKLKAPCCDGPLWIREQLKVGINTEGEIISWFPAELVSLHTNKEMNSL